MSSINGYTEVRTIVTHGKNRTVVVRSPRKQLFVAKIISLPKRAKDEALDRAALYCNLHHPNLLPLREYFIWSSEQHFVMILQYCGEGNLNEAIGDRTMDVQQVMIKLASTLEYLHCQRNVAHMNLRPENIMLKDGCPLIGDLGVFRLAVGEPARERNKWYTAPQDLSSSFAADIWALGVIFLELGFGHRVEQLLPCPLDKQWNYSPLELTEQVQDPQIRKLIAWMLQTDAKARPTIQQVCAFLKSKPIGELNAGLSRFNEHSKGELISKLYIITEEFWYGSYRESQLKKQYCRYIPEVQQEAQKGNLKAMFLLGRANQLGIGVPQNAEVAKQWLLKCADANEPFSFLSLFFFETDVEKKKELLRRGVVAKSVRCLCQLGKYLFYGIDGTEINQEEGLKLLRQSADQQYPDAWFWLGRTASNSPFSFFSTDAVGQPYFSKGAQLGNAMCTEAVGRVYHAQSNFAKALECYLKAYSLPGNPISVVGVLEGHIGLCYHNLGDRVNGKLWLEKAAMFGDQQSIDYLVSLGYK